MQTGKSLEEINKLWEGDAESISPRGKAQIQSQMKEMHSLTPAGEKLVSVGLMTDVENDAVVGSVEDVVHRDGQLDRAEAACEVTADLRAEQNQFLAKFICNLSQRFSRQAPQIRRKANFIKKTAGCGQDRCARYRTVGSHVSFLCPLADPFWTEDQVGGVRRQMKPLTEGKDQSVAAQYCARCGKSF